MKHGNVAVAGRDYPILPRKVAGIAFTGGNQAACPQMIALSGVAAVRCHRRRLHATCKGGDTVAY
ncbi:MAG TPA: hypothetical protein VIF82_04045 [Burkholderiaceae bacterium]